MFLTVSHLFYQIFQLPYRNHTKPFVGVFEKSQIPARDVFETSQTCHGKDIIFEICLRRLKDVIQKTSFLRCFWDVLKTSQKRHPFWDVFETSHRCLKKVVSFEMFLRGLWNVSLNGDLTESLRDISCRLGGGSRNPTICDMKLFATVVHDYNYKFLDVKCGRVRKSKSFIWF